MRPHRRIARAAFLLALGLAGCSSTGGPKFGAKSQSQSRSIAMVGDRPMPAIVGAPGEQVAADVIEPEPKRNPVARISGRVLDGRGQPVPDATVRLADGGQQGGRDSRTATDRSGAFTLGGLRVGSDYVIVAEAEAEGATQTGRARARTSDTGVTITLGGGDDDSTPARRPARTRPISSREYLDDPAEEKSASRINREDLDPPPAGAADEDRPAGRKATSGTAQLSPPVSAAGWRKPGSSAPADPTDEETDDSARPRKPRQPLPADDLPTDDDGPNPLPPAIERPGSGQAAAAPGRSSRNEPGALTLAEEPASSRFDVARANKPGQTGGLLPMPMEAMEDLPAEPVATTASLEPDLSDTGAALALAAASDSPPPRDGAIPGDSKQDPAAGPVFSSQAVVNPEPVSNAAYDPFALAAASGSAAPLVADLPDPRRSLDVADPLKTSATIPAVVPKKWGDLADKDRPRIVVEPTRATSSGLLRRLRGQPAAAQSARARPVMLCDYDARHRKVADFQLPDLEGKPVRLRDLEADFILLDFWGTWCKPCLDSIPHLVDLQKRYGPTRLRVVGVACEKTAEAGTAARVDEFTRKLGINYTVLLSNMDGTCPLQNALQVQFYPTMVLLDRQGQILWRDRGATEATLDRLDKVLATRSTATMARR